MIFQYTFKKVLSDNKTLTARIWKEDYAVLTTESGLCDAIVSKKSGRRLYYLGQKRAVQRGRGKRGEGWIEIIKLIPNRDIRGYSIIDIEREGYTTHNEFLKVWRKMHGENYIALVIQFKVLK